VGRGPPFPFLFFLFIFSLFPCYSHQKKKINKKERKGNPRLAHDKLKYKLIYRQPWEEDRNKINNKNTI